MKCEICQKAEAVIHIQQIIGTKTLTIRLCKECAKEKGVTSQQEILFKSIQELFTGLLDSSLKAAGIKQSDLFYPGCPVCGTSYEDLTLNLQAGCSNCYAVFRKPIVTHLKQTQGKFRHRGKFPKKIFMLKNILIDSFDLKKKIQEAVNNEDYERAAELRNRLESITRDWENV